MHHLKYLNQCDCTWLRNEMGIALHNQKSIQISHIQKEVDGASLVLAVKISNPVSTIIRPQGHNPLRFTSM